ncbi:MAG: DegT/DnrJ/EryC1/StrS family aminotransferase [Candidatus Margulisiibacteriota bacterium]|jgi:dTDP-4-amino-4,6-dideoxygalactose transaminase
MAVQFFDLKRQNKALETELDNAIKSVVDSGSYILGKNVSALENEFASLVGTKFAIAVASGTDALHLALRAAGVAPGDEVITSPFTFVATAEAIIYCGAIPVFADIDPETFNLDASALKKKITKKTRAILPVHLYGQACNMAEITYIAKEKELLIIEDCAQATGAKYNETQVGAFGDAGCFSFFPTKNIGCFGDGGMVTTNSEKTAQEIKVLRGHGSRKTYHYDLIGYNSRLDELQAAILRVKLPFLNTYLEKRRETARLYNAAFKALPLLCPKEIAGGYHTYNQYTLRYKDRDKLASHLKEAGIASMVYYPLSLHLQKAFESFGYKIGDFPGAELAQSEVISLPIFPELSKEEINATISSVLQFIN